MNKLFTSPVPSTSSLANELVTMKPTFCSFEPKDAQEKPPPEALTSLPPKCVAPTEI